MLEKPLVVGDRLPVFSLPDQNGQIVNIDSFVGQFPIVIYFYPKDDTPGCTAEACSFRDQFEDFQEMGAMVFGISADSPDSHAKFKEKYKLPYTLLSDQDKKIQKLFGVKKNFLGLIDGRVTYIVDIGGVIRHIFSSQLQPKKHITEALGILAKIKAGDE
jgi:peroxiredoxin Q/BCP